jgi:agmatinase
MVLDSLTPSSVPLEFAKASLKIANHCTNIIGFPFDGTACFRKGARLGPNAIREHLQHIESYSPYLDLDLSKTEDIVDCGNLEYLKEPIDYSNKEHTHEIWKRSRRVFSGITRNIDLKAGTRLLSLGGEHSVSINPIELYLSQFEDLIVIQLDAHADLRESWDGFDYSHASIMHNIQKQFSIQHQLIQYGIRSGTRDEFEAMNKNKSRVKSLELLLQCLVAIPVTRPIYLTLDLDFLDPSEFPGTGTPEAGGESFINLIKILKTLKSKYLVGADIVELAPNFDPSGISSIVATTVFRELLLLLSNHKN